MVGADDDGSEACVASFRREGWVGASVAAADSLIWADLRGVDCLVMMRSLVKVATTIVAVTQ